MNQSYLSVSQEAGKTFFSKQLSGPIVMLNLLRFNTAADYTENPELKSDSDISGKEAYQLYIKQVMPLLEKAGSEVIFKGNCHNFLIGPQTETWDAMILVKHESAAKFLNFANDEDYLKIAGHRTAALADSRLLPISNF